MVMTMRALAILALGLTVGACGSDSLDDGETTTSSGSGAGGTSSVGGGGTGGTSIGGMTGGGGSVSELSWFCDWAGSDLGNSDDAILGNNSTGTCFDGYTSTSGDFLSVEPATPAHGFPTAMSNVLRIEFVDNATKVGSKMAQAHQQWTEPAVGEFAFYRFYDFCDFAAGEPIHAHWFHGGSNKLGTSDYGGGLWTVSDTFDPVDSSYDISYGAGFQAFDDIGGRGHGYFVMRDVLRARVLYRREHRVERVDVDSVRHELRIFDGVTGELVASSEDFTCGTSENDGCVASGGFGIDILGQYEANHDGPSSLNSLEIGNNGANDPGIGDPTTPQYWYVGGMAVRVSANGDDWIGPYPAPGTGEGA
jgi:hypothetical protein